VVDLPASLTRSRIVFLTGAGASAPLGLPTTAGFLQRFVDSAMSTRLSGMPAGVWRLGSGSDAAYDQAVAADPRIIEEQRSLFQGFVALAHEMGATKIRNGEARIVGEGASRSVVLLFSHDDFPGTRFGYRCKPLADDRYEEIWLAEELATGGLHRMMRHDPPTPDESGIVWTHLHGQLLRWSDSATNQNAPIE
jgi:hypothetical protein